MNIFKKIFNKSFILTDIKVSNINGFIMAFQYVKVHDKRLKIDGIISELSPKFIKYKTVRPKELLPPGGNPICISDIYEYFEDLRNFYYYISKEDVISENTFIKCYVKLIEHHINEKSRLVDSDLYMYIDLAIYVKSNLWKMFHNIIFNQDEISSLWLKLEKDSYQTFKESIFITEYDFTESPIHPKMVLVPLIQII